MYRFHANEISLSYGLYSRRCINGDRSALLRTLSPSLINPRKEMKRDGGHDLWNVHTISDLYLIYFLC